eukprot:scaffold4095_cov117-Cylindrotheca_fusiformis.AAC.8
MIGFRNPSVSTASLSLLVSQLVISSCSNAYRDYIPETEYDFTISLAIMSHLKVDPNSAYGSPYGGFSRATASRLASIPLTLPSIDQELVDYEPIYMTTRDAAGKQYACRVYHEDEVEPETLDDSLFEPVVLKQHDTKPPAQTTESKVPEAAKAGGLSGTDDRIDTAKKLRDRVRKLSFMCAQMHKGWWSYEWCYQDIVRQFHIHIDNDADFVSNIQIQDVTSLGSYFERRVEVFHADDEESRDGEKKVPRPPGNPNALGEITDIHHQGGWCPETGKPRMTEVVLRCCSKDAVSRNKGMAMYKGKPLETNLLSMQGIVEESVCVYNVTICTPLLCSDYVEDPPPQKTPLENLKPSTVVDTRSSEKSLDASDVKDMAVVEILNTLFGRNKCMQSATGGWWMFELCPGRHVRQFHEVTLLDRITGVPRTEIESEHLLGIYNDEDDLVTKEDEWKHVVNQTKTGSSAKTGKSRLGNGAYYAQEYIFGDVCDHEDVTDSAIKAGEFGEGGIERATTVKYACGKQLEMNVKEDSTCHYIVDVTIPALCGHPFFKAPVSKRQVVKCLPVS